MDINFTRWCTSTFSCKSLELFVTNTKDWIRWEGPAVWSLQSPDLNLLSLELVRRHKIFFVIFIYRNFINFHFVFCWTFIVIYLKKTTCYLKVRVWLNFFRKVVIHMLTSHLDTHQFNLSS